MSAIMPILSVSSLEATRDFYTGNLGFTEKFSMKGPDGKIMHLEIEFGGAMIMFGHDCPDTARQTQLHPKGLGINLYIEAPRIDALYREAVGGAWKIIAPLQDQFWGDRTFTIVDPDGYHLTFFKHVKEFDHSKAPGGSQAAANAGNGKAAAVKKSSGPKTK